MAPMKRLLCTPSLSTSGTFGPAAVENQVTACDMALIDKDYAAEYAGAVAEVELRRAALRAAGALGAALGPGTHVTEAGTVYVVSETGSRMRVLRDYVPVLGPLLATDQPSLEECWGLLGELSGAGK